MADFPYFKNGMADFPGLTDIEPSDYENQFDYSQYSSPAKLHLLYASWRSDYKDVILFDNEAARDAWMSAQDSYRTEYTTQWLRVPKQTINLPLPYEKASHYNYLYVDIPTMPVTDSDSPTRLCYFVTDIAYAAPSTTVLSLELDFWQTYIYRMEVSSMELERGHAPMYDVDVDDFLSDPIANCQFLLAPDVDFSRGHANRSTSVKHYPLGYYAKYVVMALPVSPSNLANIGAATSATSTPPTFSDTSARNGYQYAVSGYDWAYGGKEYSSATLPLSTAVSSDNRTIDNMYLYAISAGGATSALAAIAASAPHLLEAAGYIAIVPSILASAVSSTNYDICGHNWRQIKANPVVSIAPFTLTKTNFNLPAYAKDIAKCYTYPYTHLEISDNDGHKFDVRVEDIKGKELTFNMDVSLNATSLIWGVEATNVGTDSTYTVSWYQFNGSQENTTLYGADIADYAIEWGIPTYIVDVSAATIEAAKNWHNLEAKRLEALNRYHQAVRSANTAYENTVDTNATNVANTSATNATNVSNTARTNTANVANVAATNATNVSNTARTNTANVANVAATNVTNVSNTARTNTANVANVAATNATNVSNTARTNTANVANIAATNATNVANTARTNTANVTNTSDTNSTNVTNTAATNATNVSNTSRTNQSNVDNTRTNARGNTLSAGARNTYTTTLATRSNTFTDNMNSISMNLIENMRLVDDEHQNQVQQIASGALSINAYENMVGNLGAGNVLGALQTGIGAAIAYDNNSSMTDEMNRWRKKKTDWTRWAMGRYSGDTPHTNQNDEQQSYQTDRATYEVALNTYTNAVVNDILEDDGQDGTSLITAKRTQTTSNANATATETTSNANATRSANTSNTNATRSATASNTNATDSQTTSNANAARSATASNTNATDSETTSNANATRSATASNTNATDSQTTSNANAARTETTSNANAGYVRNDAVTAAQENLTMTEAAAGYALWAASTGLVKTGSLTGDNKLDALNRRAFKVNVVTQDDYALQAAAVHFMRYGYAISAPWGLSGWLPSSDHDYCYWKGKNLIIQGDVPDMCRTALETIANRGFTVWSDPEGVGEYE